jgi:replication-associated recombination protein RarA
MSSIVGMTSVIYGQTREDRLDYIDGIIKDSKHKYSSISIEIIDSDKNSIGIGEIRSLIEKSNYTSLSARHRFFIIYNAHKLTDQAQNALLKLYEEPRSDSTYILELDSYQKLLPTIISRAVLLDISNSISSNQIETLLSRHSFPDRTTLRNATLADLFKLCEDYYKDKVAAGDFLTYLTLLAVETIRTSSAVKRNQGIAYIDFLFLSQEWLHDTNASVRLLLENCAMGWWNLRQ